MAGPERVRRSRHALPAPHAGPGPASRSCASAYGSDRPAHSEDAWSPVRTTAASSTRTGSSGCGSRPSRRASSRTGEPLRPTVPATRKIRSTMRCLPRGAVASAARADRGSRLSGYLQRPLTGGRPQGRALAGPVVKTRGDRDDHPDMLVRGEPDDQFGVVALRAAAGSGTPISAGNCAASRWASSSPSAQRTCVGIRPACPT